MKNQKCLICDQPSEEIIILLQGLKKRLVNKNKKKDQEYQEMKQEEKDNHVDVFTRMVDIAVFGHTNTSVNCSHKKIYRQFYRKMRCTQSKFKQNCQEILLQIASKCYQLDVVLEQISLLEDRVLEVTKLPKHSDQLKQHQSKRNPFESSDPSHRSIKSSKAQKKSKAHETHPDLKESNNQQANGNIIQLLPQGHRTFFFMPILLSNFNDN